MRALIAQKKIGMNPRNSARLALAIALSAASIAVLAEPSLLPLQAFDVTGTSGHVPIIIGANEINTAVTTFAATDLEPAQEAVFTLESNGEDIYAAGNHRSAFQLLRAQSPTPDGYYYQLQFLPRVLIAELLAGTGDGVALTVGADRNGDSLPQADEVVCAMTSSAATPARCILGPDIIGDPATTYWVMAAAPPGNLGVHYSAVLSSGLPQVALPKDPARLPSITSLSPPYGSLLLTGPGRVPADIAFPLRLTWNAGMPLRRFYAAALMGAGPVASLVDNASALMPIVFERTFVKDANSHPVPVGPTGGGNLGFVLTAHETQQRIFIDLPPSDTEYPSLDITTSAFAPGQVATQFYAVRTDFPPPSADPLAAVAPGPENAAAAWSVTNGVNAFSVSIPHPASGRWYVVASNQTANTAQFSMNIMDSINGVGRSTPTIEPGMYFNPQRSGHGISISQAAGQQLVLWYSYLEDGAPTWYIAQAGAPPANSGWWSAQLYRVSWDGTGKPVRVGSILLTPTATNRFTFAWQLDGEQGSEAFELLAAADACVSLGNAAAALSGNWFAPAEGGYGVDVLSRANQQFDIVYIYDALGLARWGIGSRSPFAANSALDILQSAGFCPTCSWKPVTTQPLGTLMMDYSSASNGMLAMNFALNAPLSGNWNVSQPMLRLTGSSACSQ